MKSILVIEDVKEVRENICEILELSGYQVFAAKNGSEGVEQATHRLPDLILCDVMMPRLDGYGVLKILRGNQTTNHIPFIFLTARVDKSDFRKGMGLGADDYITKPFDDTELLEAIETRLVRQESNTQTFAGPLKNWHSDTQLNEIIIGIIKENESITLPASNGIFNEGKLPKYVYYMQSGLVKEIYVNDDGKQLITGLYGPGDFIGIATGLEKLPYRSSTFTMTSSIVTMIPIEQFIEMCSSNRIMSKLLFQSLHVELAFTKDMMLSHAYNSVRKKVAEALMLFYKYQDENNNLLSTRDDLTMISGVAKETLIRTLSAFKSEKLISMQQKKIQVLNLEALNMLSQ